MAARQALPELWERQDAETPKQFEAFEVYRGLGPKRTARQVAESLHKSWDLIHRWQAANQWIRRAEAYDRAMERERLLDAGVDRRDMHMRHARLASSFLGKVAHRLNGLKPEELSPRDLSQWLDVATKAERIARGEYAGQPTSNTTTGAAGQAERPLTEEERQVRLEQLHAEIVARLEVAPSPGMVSGTVGDELARTLEADE